MLSESTFVKFHGLGNDYLVVDPASLPFALTASRIHLICHRHLGVGSDGILALGPGRDGADLGLRILNPDGSEAEKSGNGIRIFAKWARDTGRIVKDAFAISTPGGVVPVHTDRADNGSVRSVTANMGVPVFRSDLDALELAGERLTVSALSIGNPHCVVFRERLDEIELRRLGPLIERHAAFPQRTNVQFARADGRNRLEALIWERGAGETLASGSSACAVAAAFYRAGLTDADVSVAMPGGNLAIRIDSQGAVWMTGPVEEVGAFTLSASLIERLLLLG